MPHILGPGGPLPHAKNEVDRTTRSGDMAKRRVDRQTRDRHDLPTNQPSVLPVPSCKLEIAIAYARLVYMLSRAKNAFAINDTAQSDRLPVYLPEVVCSQRGGIESKNCGRVLGLGLALLALVSRTLLVSAVCS